jgi:hypothetical protein
MKKIICAFIALYSAFAFSATLNPIQLLNPAGSSSGQAIVSTGASTAPTWGNVTLGGLQAIAANTLIGNATGSTASPTAITVAGCNGAAQALQWTNGSGFGCNSSVATSGANTNITSLNSPALGAATATTAAAGTNTTQVATTAFVQGINAGRLLNVQVFTSSGTYTPTSGTNKVIVEVQAPGGGGGGVAASSTGQNAIAQAGSGGSYAEIYWASPASTTVTIGAVGSAGAAGINAGGTGGATSVGSVVSCPGGVGGAGSAGQASGFTQNGAAAPANCTISGATVIRNVAGATSAPVTNMSSAAAYPVKGGYAAMGYNTNGGNGSGGDGAAIPASTGAAAGITGVGGKVIFYEYN